MASAETILARAFEHFGVENSRWNEAALSVFGRKDAWFLTCEHASNSLPQGYEWHPEDRIFSEQHWAFDLGAADLCLELAKTLEAPAVLALFSRLLIDANRDEKHPTLIRTEADGHRLRMNKVITDDEREHRLQRFHRPFHSSIDQALLDHQGPVVFAIHSFTPVYEGNVRPMEVGVLFDEEEELAQAMHSHLAGAGFASVLNEPYSGKDGLIHVVSRAAKLHRKKAMELEVRQDLAVQPEFRKRLVSSLAAFIGDTR